MEGDSVHALCGLEKSLRFGTQRKLVEHHGELWNSTQDGRSRSGTKGWNGQLPTDARYQTGSRLSLE